MATLNVTPKAILGKYISVVLVHELGLPYTAYHEFSGEVISVCYDADCTSICIGEHGYFDLSTIEITKIA